MRNPNYENDVESILAKYGKKLENTVSSAEENSYSKEYKRFKEELAPSLDTFERLCRNARKIIKINLKKKEEEEIKKFLDIAHLDISPTDAASFSMLTFLFSLFISIFLSVGIYLVTNKPPYLIFFMLFFISIFLYYYVYGLPQRLAQKWRLKASSQMVPCILYIVVYMRHTSNLELAIEFASQHLQAPLSLDFKKIFWNVETGKYSTIKESLDAYLETWRDYSLEFIEAFHLIEGSLYEPNESRRIESLDKALNGILDGIKEKMEDYTNSVQAPLTNLYMLGIVLPTLAIALLPLASTLVGESFKWYHVMILFDIIVPFFVFYLTNNILAQRPGGYGEEELLEQNPNYHYYKSNKPYYTAAIIAIPFILIGLMPLLWNFTPLPNLLGLQKDYTFGQLGIPIMENSYIFDYKGTAGPFSVFALLLSLCIPLGMMLFFYISYNQKTKILLKTRNETKKIEEFFASSMFQLGNRLADGVPAELVFGRVAESSKGTPSEDFFKMVNSNIQRLGMSVNEAIFNRTRGAILYFPSPLIKTSMKILIESVKKGLSVASRALMSISQYVKNIHSTNERLKNLLAEVVSSMQSNISFLAPVLAGIVIGLSAMITVILNQLQTMIQQIPTAADTPVGLGSMGQITELFKIQNMVPPYFLQIIIGVYLVEIVYILTITLVSIESGADKLREKAEIAKNLKTSIMMFLIVALFSIVILTALATIAVGRLVVT